jgi:23S rRNA (pseudouridine1915-N3)-methyltransferase
MLKITVLAVGKLKEKCWQEVAADYTKRVAPYAKLSVVEVTPEPTGATVSGSQSMKAEGERLLARIPADSFVVALERTGKEMSSTEFAALLQREGEGGRTVSFIVGGAEGLDGQVLAKANLKLSFSKMTFLHEMARVFLLEQLYRAATILAGKTYHR